jgi:DNA polymerase III alpha subunit
LYERLWDAAKFIDGLPRHIGTHACGIVVSPRPLADRAPLQIAPKGLQVTQYEMHAVEALGMLKIDLLGVRSLSVIADVAQEAETRFGETMPLNGLLPYDEGVYRTINEARTLGCFQLESPGMRQLLHKLNVVGLETIIDSISVIRPGPNDAGMMRHYVARKNGKEPVTYLDPRLEPILKPTCGILLYQEDVLKVASVMAGMSLGEADVFRRAMTKLRTPENMEANRRRFIEGALAQGVAPEVAKELWRQVSGFAGYAFCNAHSVSYGILAYQSAWLKHHYPALFMAATINHGGGFYSTAVYVEEARRLGLRIQIGRAHV